MPSETEAPDERDALERARLGGLSPRARITVVQPGVESPVSLGNLAAVDRLLEEGERMGEDVVSTYMGGNGRFVPGAVHAPLHIHPYEELALSK